MNDTIDIARIEGTIELDGDDIYERNVEPGPAPRARRHGVPKAEPVPEVDLRQCRLRSADSRPDENKSELDDIVQSALERAAMWNEVKDRLDQPGTGLSGGQQQRLCIARAVATERRRFC